MLGWGMMKNNKKQEHPLMNLLSMEEKDMLNLDISHKKNAKDYKQMKEHIYKCTEKKCENFVRDSNA